MTHIGSRLQRLERLEVPIWLWNLNVRRHVGIWPRERCRFYPIRRQRLLQLLSLHSLHSVVVFSRLVSKLLFPLCICIIGWSDTVFHSLNSFFENNFLFFFLLLKLKGFTLKHRELRYSSQHLSWELCGPSFILIDFLSNLQSALSSIESLSS